MIRAAAAIAVATLLTPAFCISAFAEGRVALVIGNSAYQNAPSLANPRRDAQAMADALKNGGFTIVHAHYDLGNLQFKRAVRQFEDAANDADIAVVFYAGHGNEIHGTNYMIPVDAKLTSDRDADDEAITLDRLVASVEEAKRLGLVILDACRDNPFVRRMKRARTAAVRGVMPGLGIVEPPTRDTLIAYAAKSGFGAEDGDSDHSPFTAALLKHLFEPGLDIRIAFGRVRDEVLRTTGNRQEPFVSGSLGGGHIALVPASAEQSVAPPDPAIQLNDYNLAKEIGTKGAWESFLARHPTGFYADLARQQFAKLTASEEQNTAAAERVRERIAREQSDRAERDQTERLARERAERERIDQERFAKEHAEQVQREQAGNRELESQKRDETEHTSVPPRTQTALVTPPTEPAAASPAPRLLGRALIVEIKKELKRVGCYRGGLDEKWQTADASVQKFAKRTSLTINTAEPTNELLDAIRAKSERICPLECGPRQIENDGACVAKRCPSGSYLNDDGDCTPRRNGSVSRPAPEESSERTKARLPETHRARWADSDWDPRDRNRIVTPGGRITCGPNGCKKVPVGCHAVRYSGGRGLGGRVFCP